MAAKSLTTEQQQQILDSHLNHLKTTGKQNFVAVADETGFCRASVQRTVREWRKTHDESAYLPAISGGAAPGSSLERLLQTRQSLATLADGLGVTRGGALDALDAVRANPRFREEAGQFWLEQETPVDAVQADRARVQASGEARVLKQKYDAALKEIDDAQRQLEAALAIRDVPAPRAITVDPNVRGGQAVAVAIASDWHFGAIVRPQTVHNLNEVTPDITRERADRFFVNLLALVDKERGHVAIKTLCLALLGDFMENAIHDELIEDSVLSPIQEMQMAQEALIAGIDLLLARGDFERIVIPTARGNHGRTTMKMRIQTSYKNSYEQLMYWSMAKHYRDKGESRVEFHISDGYANYLPIFDEMIRVHHGDAVRYQGGVGGLHIPLRKWNYRANEQRKASMSVCGHFHSLLIDYDYMVNGSLIGPTAYSLQIGFPPEKPQQIFRLLDAQRGWTAFFPILVK